MLSAIANWSVKRRRLLAGVAGAVVETAAACVPGVGIAAKLLGTLIEKGTEEALAPDEKPSAEQLAAVNAWLAKLTGCYGDLLDRLERLPDSASLEESNRQVREALRHNEELASLFDAHLTEVRKMTLSLGVIEQKLDEHFHVQKQMNASLEEIKEVFVAAPMRSEWHEFRRARPEAVRVLIEADDHFLAGRRDEGARLLLRLLDERGVGQQTVAHALGLVEFGQGKVSEAVARLTGIGGALQRTGTRLATLAGKKAGSSVWRSLPRGFVINRKYRIEAEVGRGGMASVYRANKTRSFDSVPVVAIKVPALSDDPAMSQRFEKEIQRTKRLRHDNIVRVEDYEIFEEPFTGRESYGLVMEYVPGASLSRYLEGRRVTGKPLSEEEVRNVMIAVCDALEYAHGNKILHRDIKPHNILVARGGVIKLMDFGIARDLDEGDGMTKTGEVVGTLAYMPPEMQFPEAANPVGIGADVYMCGVLLRELLTFHPNGKLARADCPPTWRELIRDACHRDPGDRPESVVAFRSQLLGTQTVEIVDPKPVVAVPIVNVPEAKVESVERVEPKPDVVVPAPKGMPVSPAPNRVTPTKAQSSFAKSGRPCVGIDFGTSKSIVANFQFGQAVVVPNHEGQKWTPSIVTMRRDGTLAFGQEAKENFDEQRSIRSIQRILGTPERVPFVGQNLRTEQIAVKLFSLLKKDAEQHFNESFGKAVVTIPANSKGLARHATKLCAGAAGLQVLTLLNEPTAAAIGYGLNAQDDQTVLVYDFGSTLDATILRIHHGIFEELSSKRIDKLGGDDIDAALGKFLAERFQKKTGYDIFNSPDKQQFILACEKAKIELSSEMTTQFRFATQGGPTLTEELDRGTFERLLIPLAARSGDAIDEALRLGALKPKDIDEVLLVGGTSKIPLIRRYVGEKLAGKEPKSFDKVDPVTCVAQGAAIMSAILQGAAGLDNFAYSVRLEHSLCVPCLDRRTGRKFLDPIIKRGSDIPCSFSKIYRADENPASRILIELFEGDVYDTPENPDNVKLAEIPWEFRPPRPQRDAVLDVSFQYQEDGILTVLIHDVHADLKMRFVIQQTPL